MRITKKIKGNTILEVLIALAITSFCTALASVIYLHIQKSSLPFFKLKAVELSEKYMYECRLNGNYSEETFHPEEFTVKKFVSPHALLSDCFVIRVVVFDGSLKKIHELESLVHQTD